MLYSVFLCCLPFIVVLLFFGWSKVRGRNTPPGPFGLPLIGNLFQLGDSPHIALTEMAQVYGSVFCIRLGARKAIVLNSHDVVKEALARRSCHFSSRPPFHNFLISSNGGKSIAFGYSGPLHKRNKKLASRALHAVFSDVKRFNTVAQQETERFCRELIESTCGALDLTSYIRDLLINFSFRLVFGDNFKTNYAAEFQNIFKRSTAFIENNAVVNLLDFFPWLHFAFRKQCKALKASLRELMDFVGKVYNLQRHASVEDAGVNAAASLDKIIEEEIEEEVKMQLDNDSVVTIIADIFGAGIETVSTAFHWALLFILSDPGLQKELQAELKREIGTDRLPTLEDRARLPLLQATVLEVLRKATVVPLALPHYTTEDSTVAGYHIPKNSTVIVNLWALSHDANHFQEPEAFNPYRFLDEAGQIRLDLQPLFLPFSIGGRRCLGDTLAKAELFMFLGCMLQLVNLQLPCDSEKPNLHGGKFGLTLKPFPFKAHVVPRTTEQYEH